MIAAEARAFWSFQPIQDPPPPSVKNTSWPRGAVDSSILAGLEERGLRPGFAPTIIATCVSSRRPAFYFPGRGSSEADPRGSAALLSKNSSAGSAEASGAAVTSADPIRSARVRLMERILWAGRFGAISALGRVADRAGFGSKLDAILTSGKSLNLF